MLSNVQIRICRLSGENAMSCMGWLYLLVSSNSSVGKSKSRMILSPEPVIIELPLGEIAKVEAGPA